MRGGTGKDIFQHYLKNDSTLQDSDHILDFNRAEGDKIDLHMIHEKSGRDLFFTNGPSTSSGAVWSTGSGQDWKVFVNTDGGAPDMQIEVHLSNYGHGDLNKGDFLF